MNNKLNQIFVKKTIQNSLLYKKIVCITKKKQTNREINTNRSFPETNKNINHQI